MFKRKSLNDRQVLNLVRLINASKKFLVFLALLGQLVSLLPQINLRAQYIDNPKEEIIEEIKTKDNVSKFKSENLDISIVPIVNEDESRRTANEKHFRKLDGTYEVAIYNNEVHYLENGKWLDIDNSFSEKDDALENKNNLFKVIFPKSLNDNKAIQIKTKEYSIDWKVIEISESHAEYRNAEKKLSLSSELTGINQSVLYKNVRNEVDLKYILQGSDVKEFIILNKYFSDFSMSFEYTLNNLNLIENEEGIFFVNLRNEPIFKFEDLFMVDHHDNLSYEVDYEILQTRKDTYRITIIPNNEWLSKASYPVMIDPTLVSTTTSMSIFDAYISQANPSSVYKTSQHIFLSNTSYSAQYRGLIQFNLPTEIMNQVITYAHLSFTPNMTATNAQLNIYKNTSPMPNNPTWNTAPSYDPKVIDYHIINNVNPIIFDVTASIKEWQSEGVWNTSGFTIALKNDFGSFNSVYSIESVAQSTKPSVKIGYEEPSGLKDYWTYTSQNAGMVGTGYISDYTGNLTWVRNEYKLENEYLSLALSFLYNYHSKNLNIGYGNGWKTNYTIEVKHDSSINLYYMHKPDGNKIYFMNNVCTLVYPGVESCKSIAEDGSRMELERMTNYGQNQSMSVTTTSGLKYNFNAAGRLSSIHNTKTQHSLSVYYVDSTSLRINYVKDEADNRINFTYFNSMMIQTKLTLKQANNTYREVERRDYNYDSYNSLDYIDYDF
jgi:hypothetical protein